MSVEIKINGVDKTSLIQWKTLRREENLSKEPSKMSFSLSKNSGQTFKPVVGDTVLLTIGGTKEFGGYVVEVREALDSMNENIDVICKDYTHELDRLLVSKTYTSTTVEDIIDDLISTFAPTFTIANVSCDKLIDKVIFNYLPVSKCLEKLTDLASDYEWYCDYDKDIHFFLSNIDSPSLYLDDNAGNYVVGSLNTHEDTHQLRNEIIIRGGLLTSTSTTEELLSGDGTKIIFPLATKFASLPAVTVGGVSKTVGIANIDSSGYQVYWDYNEKSLRFSSPPASASNNISIVQVYEYPLILQKRDEDSILTYGIFQHVIVDKNIRDYETAGLRADAELIKYAFPAKTANFVTRTQGIKCGDTINVQSDIRGTDDNYRINMIRSTIISPVDDTLEHTVEAVNAEDLGINDILALLLVKNPSDQITIAQGEVVARIRQLSDSFSITDNTPTATPLSTSEYTWTSGANPLVWDFGSWEYTYTYDSSDVYDLSVWEI